MGARAFAFLQTVLSDIEKCGPRPLVLGEAQPLQIAIEDLIQIRHQ